MRSGIELLEDLAGDGALVQRKGTYRIRLRMWLNQGDPIRWQRAWGSVDVATLEDGGATLITKVRVDRRSLISGIFYGVEGMRIGGTRRLKISPHLAYREQGVPGIIPPNAVLTVEISFLADDPRAATALEAP
jgi:hypothetical protein